MNRPREKQARIHVTTITKRPATKLAKLPAGAKLHKWTFKEMLKGGLTTSALWRCVVCDHVEKALWPHTPDAHEPFCPAPMGMVT